jgi:ribosomal protein L9
MTFNCEFCGKEGFRTEAGLKSHQRASIECKKAQAGTTEEVMAEVAEIVTEDNVDVQKVDKDTPIVDNENISQDKEPVKVNLGASVSGNDSLPKRTPSIGASLDGEKEIVFNKHAYKPQNLLSQELKPELAAKFDTYWCSANEMPEKTSIGYIPVKTDETGKLYGSVTSNDIADALKEQGFEIDKHSLLIEKIIKELGVFDIKIRLHPEVETNIKVWVVEE